MRNEQQRKKCQGDKTEEKHKMEVDTCFFFPFLLWHKEPQHSLLVPFFFLWGFLLLLLEGATIGHGD